MVWMHFLSSGNMNTMEEKARLRRSLMHMAKRGPNILPLGTPEVTGRTEEKDPSTMTTCNLSVRQNCIQDNRFSEMPLQGSLWRSAQCEILSNACLKSRKIMSVWMSLE